MDNKVTLRTIWQSKLALRLIPTFVAVVAVPLAVTVVVVGRTGRDQTVATAHSMQQSNLNTVAYAGTHFQKLGQAALQSSSDKIAQICLSASASASKRAEHDQATSMAASGKDFDDVTQRSLDGAMHQSLAENGQVLSEIGTQMGSLFANSARYTQATVEDRVQAGILDQANTQMVARATQLSQLFDSYIQTNVNYLGLTAEMLTLYEDNSSGQKAVLDALVRRFPMMTTVTVLDSSGNITNLSASDRIEQPSDLVNQSYAAYFRTAIKDQNFVGVDYFPVNGSAPVLRLAVPVELYRGKSVGVLSATLSLSDLWDTIRNTHFGRLGYAYVADGNGFPFLRPRHLDGSVLEQSAVISSTGWRLVVAEPESEVLAPMQSFKSDISRHTQHSLAQMHGDIAAASAFATSKLLSNAVKLRAAATIGLRSRTQQILSQFDLQTGKQTAQEQLHMRKAVQSQVAEEQRNNSNQMIAAADAAANSLESSIPKITANALDRADRRLGLSAVVILIISCGMSCLIGFLLAGAVVKPILRLLQGTRSLAIGDLDKRVDERAPAEIGDLAIAFNKMAASLQKSRADLTDAESQLVQSAKLASLGTLSAGVAHELNQPVAIVRGIAQQLKVDDTISPDVREDLRIIEGQTGRMMKIITHLRTFCRTGGYEMVPVDSNRVIKDCFILIDAQLKSHGVAVEMDLCDDIPLILGDANELEQVFINLITNARDALDGVPGATLSISSRVQQQQVVLVFKDNGPGIPAEVLEHIFDPFFTTKEVGKGTGLGLSISHGLIQKHRGTITAENKSGAVFTITVPLTHAAANIETNVSTAESFIGKAA